MLGVAKQLCVAQRADSGGSGRAAGASASDEENDSLEGLVECDSGEDTEAGTSGGEELSVSVSISEDAEQAMLADPSMERSIERMLSTQPAWAVKEWWHKLVKVNIRFGSSFLIIASMMLNIRNFLAFMGRTEIHCDITAVLAKVSVFAFNPPFHCAVIAYFSLCLKWPRLDFYMFGFVLYVSSAAYSIQWVLPHHDWNIDVECDGFHLQQGNVTKDYDLMAANFNYMLLSPLVSPLAWIMEVMLAMWVVVGYLEAIFVFGLDDAEAHVRGVFLVLVCVLVIRYKRMMERDQMAGFLLEARRQQGTEDLFRVLSHMLPPHLVEPMLFDPGRRRAKRIDRASILFINVEGFDDIAQGLTAKQLVSFLNQLFSDFDGICSRHEVTKIETIGAEYVAAVGVVPRDCEADGVEGTDGRHAACLGRLVRAALEVLELVAVCGFRTELQRDVEVKMGIHTGPVVAGVVGGKLPRFRLFGDTVNTAARMMQKGLPGEVQFGEATQQNLPSWVKVAKRGEILMKGKGQVMTYLLSHGGGCQQTSPLSGGSSEAKSPGRLHSERSLGLVTSTGSLDRAHSRLTGAALRCVNSSRARQRSSRQSMQILENAQESVKDPPQGTEFRRIMGSVDDNMYNIWTRFSKSQEEAFQQWSHKHVWCNGLRDRVISHITILVMLTAMELTVLVFVHIRHSETSEEGSGLMNYVVCRILALAVCLPLLFMSSSKRIIQKIGRRCLEAFVLSTTCAAVGLVFWSYCVLRLFHAPQEACENGALDSDECNLHRNIILADVLPAFILQTNQYPFRLGHSVFFPIATIGIILTSRLFGHPNEICRSFVLYFLCINRSCLMVAKFFLRERLLRSRFNSFTVLESTQQRISDVLSTLMPPLVVKELENHPSHASEYHQFQHATLVQSDLCGFTALVSGRCPEEVVDIISELFGHYDDLADMYSIYKVETVGDAYIAGQAEPPLSAINSPCNVVRFGLEIVKATHRWSEARGDNVSCRVGVHVGPCVGGIVGVDMQRYHLFGKLMNTLDVLESTAPQGAVQVSTACRNAVEREIATGCVPTFTLQECKASKLMTSKGGVHDLSEVGGTTYLASLLDT